MEATDLLVQLTCPKCRSMYTDPVSLQCGHIFCRLCIDYVLDIHAVYGEYTCPVCKVKLKKPPLLPSSTEMLQKLQSYRAAQAGTEEEEEKVYCLYCEESQVRAVKTCVQCETPLCDQHLEAHNKKLTHVLIPPTASKCSEHGNLLRYYCSQDAACICESCGLTGRHRGHEIMAVNKAFDDEKERLQDFLCKLKMREEKIDKRIQSMKEVTGEVKERTATLNLTINGFIKELRKQITFLQIRVKDFLYREIKRISRPEVTRQLQKQKEALSRKIGRVEELCTITDPAALMQKVERDKAFLWDDHEEETEPKDDLIPSVDDLNRHTITAFMLHGLSQIVGDFNNQYTE